MNWLERQAARQSVVWLLLTLLGVVVIVALLMILYTLLGGKPGWFPFLMGMLGGFIWGRLCARYRLKAVEKFQNNNLK